MPVQMDATCFGGLYALGYCRAELPLDLVAAYPSNPGKMLAARQLARAALLKYVPNPELDERVASDAVRTIEVWIEQRADLLDQAMRKTALDTLPEQIQQQLGIDEARQFILAAYSVAVYACGYYETGAIQQWYGSKIPSPQIDSDMDDRLNVFLSIVKMDQNGDLALLFGPQQALGLAPFVVGAIVVGVVIAAVATAALFLVYRYSTERLRAANDLFAEMCRKAQAEGDAATVKLCIDSLDNVRKQDPWAAVQETISKAVWIVVGLLSLAIAIPLGMRLMKKGK